MKITTIKLYHVAPRWLFLAIHTDAGITGWGEPVLEGRARTAEAAVNDLSDYLIGKDPRQINDIWNILYRSGFYRGGPIMMSAIAGIDQALWDIKGKELGKPVYDLLGGTCRDKMKVYTWVGGDDPKEEIAEIERQIQFGRDTFKLNGCGKLKKIDNHRAIDAVVERISGIRETFGSEIDFGLDFHGRVSVPMAKILLHELECTKPLFVEEPVLPEQYEHYAILSQHTSIPLAAGERMFSRYDFKHVLEQRGLSIIQPDPSHAGGITECIKIAAMAEAYDVSLAPHCSLGPIALAASLTVDFVSPNAVLQEFPVGMHYNQGADVFDYILNKEDFFDENGYVKPPSKPGLGVEINEEFVLEASNVEKPDWKPPLWRHDDGSVAEW